MAASPVRIAVVGAGRMGRVHIEALARSRGARAVAVVDPLPAAREALATTTGVRTYATLDELLAARGFDAVLVAAPSTRHADIVTMLASAGLPVLCEKPCGTSVHEAAEVAAAAERTGIPLQIGYWRRFVPELRALRERIAAGDLGEVTLIASHQWDRDLPEPGFRAASGGIAVDLGVHEFDQARWMLGQEFESVTAMPAGSSDVDAGPADPDSAAVLARMSGGTAASITLGRHFSQDDSCWFEAFGRHGYERCTFMWGAAGAEAFVAALAAQADAFAELVHGGKPHGAGARDAVAALATAAGVAQALQRSAPTDARGRAEVAGR